ncbi:MAG: HAMP domain-containing histidine kinase [Lachnospiraceae bacterium]|nr:HAMP domain-containing histidine kinase [Lachnospiraceae bacterium]
MRDELRKSYRGTTFLNIAISAGLTALLLLVMVENLALIEEAFTALAARFNVSSHAIIAKYTAMLMSLLGILCFGGMFLILQSSQAKYIRQITQAMDELSKGNLNIDVPVVGDDELASLASSLNTMADDIQTLIERERATEKSKNELITNVAHDLRTPLTSILGYLELLEARPDIDEQTRQKYISIACMKAKHLQGLIEELFGFTKLNYGKLALRVSELDIVQLLNQLIDEFYPVFDNNGIECEFSTNVQELRMTADGALIARLFDNLINNAVKYGKDGKMLIVKLNYAEPVVTITVTNFGAVIPEEEIPYLFNKFYRTEKSRSSTTGGTGLGLAIAKNIAELHGGSISCRSSIKGTDFEVKLRTDFDGDRENFKNIDGENDGTVD